MRESTFGIVLRLSGKFLVAAKCHDAGPLLGARDLVGLDADERIGAHPFDFPPQRREAVQRVLMARKIERRDVGLAVLFTSKPAEPDPLQELDAGGTGHFLNQHGLSPIFDA